jgi:hypothetical protein
VLDFFQKKNLSVVSKISLFQFIVKRDVLSDGESSCSIDGNEDIYIEALHRIEDLYQRNLLVQYQVNNYTGGDDSNNNKYDDNECVEDHNDDNDDVRYPNNYESDNLCTASSIAISSTSSSTITIDDNRKQVDEAVFLQSYIPTSLNDISNPQDEMIRLQTGQREHLYASAISSMLGGASSSSHHHVVLSVEESGPRSVVVLKQSTVDKADGSKYNDHRDSECDTVDDDEEDNDSDDDGDDDDGDDDEEEDGRYRKVPLPEHEIREMR